MNIVITGDFCPINRAESALQNNTVFDDDVYNIFKQADLNITNLECPLTDHDTAISKSGPALKAIPKMIHGLKQNHFNMVTLANNHIMDYGSQGLKDTIQLLTTARISFVGAGLIDDEIDVSYFQQNHIKLAVVNLCENEWSTIPKDGYTANPFSEINAFYSIKKAKANADFVIVIHHGGHEMYNLPSPRLKKTLRYFVDCGADAVINHHTHCISVNEVYQGTPIYYSLGNFVFDIANQRDTLWNFGMMVQIQIKENKLITNEYYFKQFSHEPKLSLIKKHELPFNFDELYIIFEDDAALRKTHQKLIKSKTKLFNSYLNPTNSKWINGLINKGVLPSFWHPRKRLILNNLIRCESHKEILQTILTDEISNSQ